MLLKGNGFKTRLVSFDLILPLVQQKALSHAKGSSYRGQENVILHDDGYVHIWNRESLAAV